MRVQFVQDVPDKFEAGKAYQLSPSSAARWVRRGYAIYVPAEAQRRTTPQRVKRPTRVSRPRVQA